jgi:lipopolysaccharide transport system permease protein
MGFDKPRAEQDRESSSGGQPALWIRRLELLAILTKRDVLIKYRGSMLGFLWSLITPLFLLTIYTVVFGVVLKMRWGIGVRESWGEFAVMLFCGLIPFNFCSEVISRSSEIIAGSPNYVKRIAFPTELLPIMVTASGFVHALINSLVLLAAVLLVFHRVPLAVVLLAVIWLPLMVFALAGALVVSAVGVFVRDLRHVVGLLFTALFFLTPIFYPASRVPERLQPILFLNPIAHTATSLRKVLVLDTAISWGNWLALMGGSLVLLWVATLYFRVLRRRFADVL